MWRSTPKRKGSTMLQHRRANGQGKLVSKMTKAIVTSAAFFALLLMVEPICTFIDSLPPVLNMALVFVMVGAIMLAFWLMMRHELELCEGHYER
jgi:purine-cytosine permease-like protein